MRWAFVLFLMVAPAGAADGPLPTRVQDRGKASLWLDRPADDPFSVKLAEKLTIFMRVEGEAPLEVELTEKVHSTAGWHLEGLGKATLAALDKGRGVRWEQVFVATPLQPGPQPLQLPALQFIEHGGQEEKVPWEPLKLRITTRVTKVDVSEARDRAGIEELPQPPAARPWWPWLLVGVPVAVVVALAARRRRARPVEEPLPGVVAIAALEELGRQPAGSAEEVKRFYTGLSDVLRRYLEKRFRLPATRLTTAEFSTALAKAWPQDGVQQKLLDDILQRCDLAKFAEVLPEREECQRAVAVAREFIAGTPSTVAPRARGTP